MTIRAAQVGKLAASVCVDCYVEVATSLSDTMKSTIGREAFMNIYYDTEFLEDSKTIDLISIGMVAGDGREYYAVSSELDTRRVAQNDWLMKNVMSSIEHEKFVVADFDGAPLIRDIYVTDQAKKDRATIASEIIEFVKPYKNFEFWNWYGAYDHVALCQLFGRMVDLPKKFPMFSSDIKQLHKQAGYPDMPKQPAGLHNALEDAKWNVIRYHYLKGLKDGC